MSQSLGLNTTPVIHIDGADKRPCLLFDRFIIFLMVSNSAVVIFYSEVGIPATILKIQYYACSLDWCEMARTYVGRRDLDAADVALDDLSVVADRFCAKLGSHDFCR